MGIAGSNAPVSSTMKTVLSPSGVTITKEGFLAATGVGTVADTLAHKGYVGPADILDGETSFWIMYGSDRCDFPRMLRGLGSEYEITKTCFKPDSACRWIHASIDALLEVVRQEPLDPDTLEEIVVRTFASLVAPPYTRDDPRTMEETQFSVPYALAVAVYGYEPGPEWFKPERFSDPRIQRLPGRVRLGRDEQADRVFPDMEIATLFAKDARGRSFSRRVDFAKDSPQNPMTEEDLRLKFFRLSRKPLGENKVPELHEALMNLEQFSVAELQSLLV